MQPIAKDRLETREQDRVERRLPIGFEGRGTGDHLLRELKVGLGVGNTEVPGVGVVSEFRDKDEAHGECDEENKAGVQPGDRPAAILPLGQRSHELNPITLVFCPE